MAFPNSPSDGDYATINNIVYRYASATGTWTRQQGANGTGTFNTLNITSTNNATSQSTGALVVSGGAGFQGNVHVNAVYSNNYKYANGAPFTTENPTGITNGNSNISVLANANITFSAVGIGNVLVISNLGANIAGTANITGATALGSSLTVSGVTNLGPVGNVTITGGSSGQYLQTNGSGGLSWQSLSSSSISNGTSNVSVVSSANVNISSAGNANVLVVTGTGANIAGTANVTGATALGSTLSVTGNANVGNLGTAGQIISTLATGTAPFTVSSTTQVANLNVAAAGSATTAATVTTAAQPNITSTGTLTGLAVTQASITAAAPVVNVNTTWNNVSVTFTGILSNVTDTASAATSLLRDYQVGGVSKFKIDKTGLTTVANSVIPNANGTISLGLTGSRWSTIYGLATSAQYADLAERYLADADYPVGTVLKIGGDAEITIAEQGNSGVVGTVSDKPGFLMNDTLEGEHVTSVAYIGRVPCRVNGEINRGDLLVVGSTPGVATAVQAQDLIPGTLVGKALQAYNNSEEGTIEILVGRQ